MAGISEFLLGRNARTTQLQKYTPQQQGVLNSLLPFAANNLLSLRAPQQLGNQPQSIGQQGQDFSFDPIEQQARASFQQQTIPSILERFSSMGTGGSQRSSALQQALGAAGAGLERDLAAQRQNYNLENRRLGQAEQSLGLQQQGLNLQAQNQYQTLLQNLLGLGLNQQFENIYEPETQGFLSTAGAGFAQGLGQALPMLATGGISGLPGGISALLALLGGLGGSGPQPLNPNANYYSPL